MVLACVFTMLLMNIFKLPNGFLGAFYAFAIAREDPPTTVRNGFRIVLANLAGFLVALVGIVLFIDYPLPHFLFVVAVFFLVFLLTSTLSNYAVAFGFSFIAVAASSVNFIWGRGNPPRPDIATVFWTSFGMILATLVTVLIEWMVTLPGDRPAKTPAPLFFPDAFKNPEYVRYALKGCLAATICYLFWSAAGWPGIGVCTVTCFLVAPVPPLGPPRPWLLLRLAGLLFGGVICGIGSQVLILPLLDSVVGFTLLFTAVTGAAAWAVTSHPRLSGFARTMAIAYFLTMFQGFGANPSLTASRDRLMGVLLGLLVMWLIFDFFGADQAKQAACRSAPEPVN
jgi:uncharacterized membrane protein YccC